MRSHAPPAVTFPSDVIPAEAGTRRLWISVAVATGNGKALG